MVSKSVVIKLEGDEVKLYKEYYANVVKKQHSTLMGYNKDLFLKGIKEELESIKEKA